MLPPSRTACIAAHRLGVTLEDLRSHAADSPMPRIDAIPGARVLITGPSGSGKTRLLVALERDLISRGIRTIRPPTELQRTRPVLDAIAPRLGIDAAMHALARAGLADASVMVRRVHELSAGQIERLRLAKAMHDLAVGTREAESALILDEFGATLDDETLIGVSRLLRAYSTRTTGVGIVIATHRASVVMAHLAPTSIITLAEDGTATAEQRDAAMNDSQSAAANIYDIAPGTRADLDALAHHHYRTRPPATIDRVIRATDRASGRLAGVLTLSLPTLNAAWREFAWPGRYSTPDKAANARRLNAEIRCISRVIVAPSDRALGLASAMVRHALTHAPTPNIEALAALGQAAPVFRAAGMTEYPVPVLAQDARLRDMLDVAGIEPWRLATPSDAYRRLLAAFPARFVESELRMWSDASRATRGVKHAPPEAVFAKACARLARTTRAFAWTRGGQHADTEMGSPLHQQP